MELAKIESSVAVGKSSVDIVIPCFNAGRYLRQAIDSALAQTYKPVNVVIVDDGSTDGTAEIVRSYGASIRYIYQDNKGLAGARNTGIKSTNGAFICFLDADDIILPSKLAKQMALFEQASDVDIVHGKTLCINGNDLVHPYPEQWRPYAHWEDYLTPLSFMCPFAVHAALVRRRVFDKHGLFDEEMRSGCEDWEFWMKCVLGGAKIRFSDGISGLYRQHRGSMSGTLLSVAERESALMERALGLFRQHGVEVDTRLRILSCGMRFVAIKWLALGRMDRFRELVLLAEETTRPLRETEVVEAFGAEARSRYPLQYLILAEELNSLGAPILAAACLVQCQDLRGLLKAASMFGHEKSFHNVIGTLRATMHAEKSRGLESTSPKTVHVACSAKSPSPLLESLELYLPQQMSFYSYLLLTFSILLERSGCLDRALRDARQAVLWNPCFPPIRLHYAKLLCKGGHYWLALRDVMRMLTSLARARWSNRGLDGFAP